MAKTTGIYSVEADIQLLKQGIVTNAQPTYDGKSFDKSMDVIFKQMKVSGYRDRTITDYSYYMEKLRKFADIQYLEDITADTIYNWLDSMTVTNQSKLIRLKSVKAVLSKCFNNGWYSSKFWQDINIKVDKKVKKGTKPDDVNILLSLLNLNTFIGLRDAVAVLVLYRTGVRINTLAKLQEKHLDLDNKLLSIEGAILKNHKLLKLPLDDELIHLLKILIAHNNKIRKYFGQKNSYLFINNKGNSLDTRSTNNAISKQLNKYAKKYGLDNINPHAMRRGYAKNLLEKGANVALISKALGHANLEVTTQYLDLDVDEVAGNLRGFL